MFVRQISIFLENKAGQLSAVTRLLADNQINLRALSIADTQDFGILRLIAADPRQVAMILSATGYICNVTEVLAITLDDKPGAVASILSLLSDANINLEYAYAFVSSKAGSAHLILRVSDNIAAAKTLQDNGVKIISQDELVDLV